MRYQPVYDIAEICFLKKIKHVVLCPGSRCAPLTLAFTRHPGLITKTFSDERSAGFIALGMAQSTHLPVAIVCTSGTAAYNLAPAIAEACFSETPLIVFTADRPAEWIGQHDGQTVYQTEIFGRHVKKFYQLPQEYEHTDNQWAINRIVNEALNLCVDLPPGPVHINAPFREPLYPESGEAVKFSKKIRIIDTTILSTVLSSEVKDKIGAAWSKYERVLLVAGQHHADEKTIASLSAFRNKHNVPVVHDIISNLHAVGNTVQHADLFLGQCTEEVKEKLKPDLLITFGQSLISKNLKNFLRRHSAKAHWHVQEGGPVADTFKSVTDVFRVAAASIFSFLTEVERTKHFARSQKDYTEQWHLEDKRILEVLDNFFTVPRVTELDVVKMLLKRLPAESNLHLANSMSVRYANFIGLAKARRGIQVYSNRGTSGIDGCTSTAVGHALTSPAANFLITGDLAFFYDRNAFWHNYAIDNLRILLLNNHGGLIFDLLEGPASLPEAREYFITRQMLTAKKLCEEFGFQYLTLQDEAKMNETFDDFLKPGSTVKVLEVETDTTTNKKALEMLKSKIKNSYEL